MCKTYVLLPHCLACNYLKFNASNTIVAGYKIYINIITEFSSVTILLSERAVQASSLVSSLYFCDY